MILFVKIFEIRIEISRDILLMTLTSDMKTLTFAIVYQLEVHFSGYYSISCILNPAKIYRLHLRFYNVKHNILVYFCILLKFERFHFLFNLRLK